MRQEFRITCDYTELIDPAELIAMQGDLKTLSQKNYLKLKALILKYGFNQPVSLFKHITEGATKKILDGHQRTTTVLRMREEGIEVPMVPVIYVEAENEEAAAEIILSFVSQFGQVTKDGMQVFMEKFQLNLDDAIKNLRIPDFNMNALKESLEMTNALAQQGKPEFEIVANFEESYNGLVILCENDVDWKNLKTMLGVKKKRSFKNDNVGETRIIRFNEFYEAVEKLKGNKSESSKK
jgi:hypothetical protein